jgi:dUTP pyrophosphatase
VSVRVAVKRLDRDLPLPRYAREGDAGLDLYAATTTVIEPGARAVIPTGLAIAIPPGFAGFVIPRSGLALKHGLSLVNTPGLIDAGYRGEVRVIVINHDPGATVTLARGERIAQLVIQAVPAVELMEVDELSASERGTGGFGSTGV